MSSLIHPYLHSDTLRKISEVTLSFLEFRRGHVMFTWDTHTPLFHHINVKWKQIQSETPFLYKNRIKKELVSREGDEQDIIFFFVVYHRQTCFCSLWIWKNYTLVCSWKSYSKAENLISLKECRAIWLKINSIIIEHSYTM